MKSKTTAGVLALFLGGLGAHKFYLGQNVLGVIYFLFCWTYIPALIGLVEAIIYFTMNDDQFHMKYNGDFLLDGGYQATLSVPHRVAYQPPIQPTIQSVVVNVPAAPQNLAATSVTDVSVELRKLYELHTAGILTEEEFTAQKRRLLSL